MSNKNRVYKVYIHGWYSGFKEKNEGLHLGYFEEIFKRTQIKNYVICDNYNDSDVLLDSLFDQSIISWKDWKIKIHFSGESRTREKLCFDYARYENYHIVLRGHDSQENIIDLPGFAPYILCNNLYDRLVNRPFSNAPIPKKFCCFIVTNWGTECRNNMFEELCKYKKVDSGGKFKNNIGYIVEGHYWDKQMIDFISQYKFIICFENTKEDNYITEKIINPFLAGCVPIYWGTESRNNTFNKNAYLSWDEINDPTYEKIIEEIKKLDNDDVAYLNMRNAPVFKEEFDFHKTYGFDSIAEKIDKLLPLDNTMESAIDNTTDNNEELKHEELTLNLIPNVLFYCPNKDTYPPFKKGLYMEEYFMEYMKRNKIQHSKSGRFYIPALWTNFQIESWFRNKRIEMHYSIHDYYYRNQNQNGYFVVVQHDDGPDLGLPENSRICGACNGDVILPLIYEDTDNKLETQWTKKCFQEKTVLCSFVGTITHHVRQRILNKFENNKNFSCVTDKNWSSSVNSNKQYTFVVNTLNSKFALAPRGYGKSSFRFFEIFKLGTVPIYIWDDREWLPYKDILDYSKFSVSINVSELDTLEEKLLSVTEEKYNEMLEEYKKIKHMFELEYMCEYIINTV
jgi:hypothetical protein